MEYPVQYARTSDGVNIAFSSTGEGEPLIYLPAFPWSHFVVMYGTGYLTSHPEAISAGTRLVTYDARGCGLSDHSPCDLSLDGLARDIDAIAQTLGISKFGLYASADAARIMIHYAATRPERVTKLILWLPSTSSSRLRGDATLRSLRTLVAQDWEIYLQTIAHGVYGKWDTEHAPYATAWVDTMRAAVSEDEFGRIRKAMHEHDVSDELAAVRAHTLVMTRENASLPPISAVQEVAAGISGAKFVVSPGHWLLPCTDDVISRVVLNFLGGLKPESRSSPSVASNGHDTASPLSPREREVVALLAEGRPNAEIAARLDVAASTASRHVHNILTKLGMSRRSEAAAYAVYEGIAKPRGATGDGSR